jgi:hypothetical protein
MLLTNYALERFLYRLCVFRHPDSFVLKGGPAKGSSRIELHPMNQESWKFHGPTPPKGDFENRANAIRASSEPAPFNSADCRR